MREDDQADSTIYRVEPPDDAMVYFLRNLTGAQRLATADRMYHNARAALLRYISAEHPDWSAEQVNRETSRRLSHGTA
ncbi:MAG: hypothetical protein ACP5QA_15935 [Phycisphaerae bacterium]